MTQTLILALSLILSSVVANAATPLDYECSASVVQGEVSRHAHLSIEPSPAGTRIWKGYAASTESGGINFNIIANAQDIIVRLSNDTTKGEDVFFEMQSQSQIDLTLKVGATTAVEVSCAP